MTTPNEANQPDPVEQPVPETSFQGMPDLPARRQRSRYFFIRRRPRLRGVPRVWTRPDTKAYEGKLREEGFVSAQMLKPPVSRSLAVDFRELDQHLMPHFWRLDQQAKFFQNRYYLYQWIFIIAAFLTTALSATLVLLFGLDTNVSLGPVSLSDVLGVLTALISGAAAAVSFLGANEAPQRHWFRTRTQAESLRSLYFLYLARRPPFNIEDDAQRVQALRVKVLEVMRGRRSEKESGR